MSNIIEICIIFEQNVFILVGLDKVPCWLSLVISHINSSMLFIPILFRGCLLYFVYNLNQEQKQISLFPGSSALTYREKKRKFSVDSDVSSASGSRKSSRQSERAVKTMKNTVSIDNLDLWFTKHRYLASNKFLLMVSIGWTIFDSIIIIATVFSYKEDLVKTGCYIAERYKIFLPLMLVALSLFVILLIKARNVSDEYDIRYEIISFVFAFFILGITYALSFFPFGVNWFPPHVFHRYNVFSLACTLVLTVSLLVPLIRSYRVKWKVAEIETPNTLTLEKILAHRESFDQFQGIL